MAVVFDVPALQGASRRRIGDHRQALPVNQPEVRERTIPCGCALFNLRVAAAAAALEAKLALLADAADADRLARVRLTPAAETQAHAELSAAMADHHDTATGTPAHRSGSGVSRSRETRAGSARCFRLPRRTECT